MFRLEKYISNQQFDAASLAKNFDFNAAKSGNIVSVSTAPKRIMFFNEAFLGRFIFSDNGKRLKKIVLYPIIKGLPQYPSEESQTIKVEFVKSFLERHFGNDFVRYEDATGYSMLTSLDASERIETNPNNCKIGYYVIVNGYDKYNGGNIILNFA